MFGIGASLAAAFSLLFAQAAPGPGGGVGPGSASAPVPAPAPSEGAAAEGAVVYKLGPGDQLGLLVLDEPQFTGNFFVGPDGSLSLPWLGDVPAAGRTLHDVRADIETRLKSGFIVNPGVSLQLVAFRPFFILGEVNKPGQYPYVPGLTARGAIATAGGFTYRAKTSQVFIKHSGEDVEVQTPLSALTKVRPGDTVRIAESYF